ncbi:isoprenylcysteine carboxylmethyltransferase family protein [Corallococcus sp. CA047B]|uniref:methyltransferase family protein n=1 Tax=Corallococcus sp. CA047B TaxID=2316729 RepID=UPI000EA3FFC0|nr:isoprenylcysteine carboxylmethyltransferase family protein [Corallococcus sp. CA047B]RKH16924.1 isoprenylcysteine carboxylmethyltransferase family protein [Corallococcus sp. CA047B]
MMGLREAPGVYLGFICLHVLAGHLGSSLVYRLRFGRSPLAYRSAAADSAHTRVTRRISGVSLLWAGSVLATAFWPAWSAMSWGRPLLPIPPLAGWVLGVVGLMGMLWAQYAMGPAFRIGVDAGEARPELHEGGLHRYSRNPIYVFSYLYLVGASLWAPSVVTLGACAALGGLFHQLVLQEERFLADRLGEPYARYCQRAPRYF